MPLQTTLSTSEQTVFIALEGDLDATSAPVLQESVDGAMRADIKRLVLDLSKLDYLSSAGLRQLVYAQQKLDEDVRIVLVGANPRVTQTIQLVGFDQSVTLTDRLPE